MKSKMMLKGYAYFIFIDDKFKNLPVEIKDKLLLLLLKIYFIIKIILDNIQNLLKIDKLILFFFQNS